MKNFKLWELPDSLGPVLADRANAERHHSHPVLLDIMKNHVVAEFRSTRDSGEDKNFKSAALRKLVRVKGRVFKSLRDEEKTMIIHPRNEP